MLKIRKRQEELHDNEGHYGGVDNMEPLVEEYAGAVSVLLMFLPTVKLCIEILSIISAF